MAKSYTHQLLNHKAKRGGTPSHVEIYQKLASHSDYLIEGLLALTESRNENIRLGALNTLIDKILPDKKATEVTGQDNGPILIKIVSEK